jgi:hypothetical protein
MNKIIVFFYLFFLGFVKSEMNFEVKFEVQHFENNITISEVYYSDIYTEKVDEIVIKKNCRISYMNDHYTHIHMYMVIYEKHVLNINDCLSYLYPAIKIRLNEGHVFDFNQAYWFNERTHKIHHFIQRFYLYTQLEQINQKIKKYQINIDDLF